MQKKEQSAANQIIQQFLPGGNLFDLLPQMMFLFDSNGALIDANSSARDMCNLKSINNLSLEFHSIFRVPAWSGENAGDGIPGDLSEDLAFEAELICSTVPIHITLNVRRLEKHSDGTKAILIICNDLRGILDRQRSRLKNLHLQNLKRRIRLFDNIACLTVHECAQPLSALRLELEILQKELEAQHRGKNTEADFLGLMKTLEKLESIVQSKRKEPSNSTGDALEGFNLMHVLQEVREFYQHRFSAEGLGFEFKSATKDVPVYANRRLVLHLLIEVVSFFEQLREPGESEKGKTVLVTLEKLSPATFILQVKGDFTAVDVLPSGELELFTQELNSLLSPFGMRAMGRTDLQTTCIRLEIPADFQEERTQLNYFARDKSHTEEEIDSLQTDRYYAE